MKYFLINTYNYLKDRTIPIIIFLFILLYLTGEYISISKKNEFKNQDVLCKEDCLPNAGQTIIKENNASCWCYLDEKTLIQK